LTFPLLRTITSNCSEKWSPFCES